MMGNSQAFIKLVTAHEISDGNRKSGYLADAFVSISSIESVSDSFQRMPNDDRPLSVIRTVTGDSMLVASSAKEIISRMEAASGAG